MAESHNLKCNPQIADCRSFNWLSPLDEFLCKPRRLQGELFGVVEVLALHGVTGVADEAHRPIELGARLQGELSSIHSFKIFLSLTEEPRRSLFDRADVDRRLKFRRRRFRRGRRGW